METALVKVLTDRLPQAQARLDGLVRKASRLGVAHVAYTVGRQWEEEKRLRDWSGRSRKIVVRWTELEVSTAPLRVGDYTFLAKLEVTPDGTLVDRVPDAVPLDPRYLHWGGDCEHCKVARRRRHLFVVRDQAGQQLAVGKACLRAFLGLDTPSQIAAQFAFWADVAGPDFDAEYGDGYRYAYYEPLESLVALSVVAVRLFGWCGRGRAAHLGATPTSAYVHLALSPRPRPTQGDDHAGQIWDKLRQAYGPEDEETAQQVIAYVRDTLGADSEYTHNLKVLFSGEAITDPKRLGLVVSAYATWARAQGRPLSQTTGNPAAPTRQSEHVGHVGDRLRDISAIYDGSRVVGSNAFGETILITFKTEAGDTLKWFTGRGVNQRVGIGQKVRLTGTIKEHEEYNGHKSTILTRCQVNLVA